MFIWSIGPRSHESTMDTEGEMTENEGVSNVVKLLGFTLLLLLSIYVSLK